MLLRAEVFSDLAMGTATHAPVTEGLDTVEIAEVGTVVRHLTVALGVGVGCE